jgi:hypothetical protein
MTSGLDTRSEHPVVADGLPGQDGCMIDDPSPEQRDTDPELRIFFSLTTDPIPA